MTRCGINAKDQIQEQELSYIKYFNNQEVITTLGASVSDIAEMGLREIARTVANLQKSEKLKNRTIEKFDKEMYSNDNEKIKGGKEDGRENRVHETRGLLHAQPSNGEREDTNREIRSDEIQLSKESQNHELTILVMNKKLAQHLTQVQEQVSQRVEELVEMMKKQQGITEELKAKDQMTWVGFMNNIKATAEEIAANEIIYI